MFFTQERRKERQEIRVEKKTLALNQVVIIKENVDSATEMDEIICLENMPKSCRTFLSLWVKCK